MRLHQRRAFHLSEPDPSRRETGIESGRLDAQPQPMIAEYRLKPITAFFFAQMELRR